MTEGPGLKPPIWRPFFRHHSFGSKLGNKNWGKTLTWHCCKCCNPGNGRVDFEEWLAYKIQLHGIEWIVSLWADWDQSPKKKKKKFDQLKMSTVQKKPGQRKCVKMRNTKSCCRRMLRNKINFAPKFLSDIYQKKISQK